MKAKEAREKANNVDKEAIFKEDCDKALKEALNEIKIASENGETMILDFERHCNHEVFDCVKKELTSLGYKVECSDILTYDFVDIFWE